MTSFIPTQVLLDVITSLQGNAYGVTIHKVLEQVMGRYVSLGEMYARLEEMEQAGMLTSLSADPTPERGGRAKRYFRVNTGEDK